MTAFKDLPWSAIKNLTWSDIKDLEWGQDVSFLEDDLGTSDSVDSIIEETVETEDDLSTSDSSVTREEETVVVEDDLGTGEHLRTLIIYTVLGSMGTSILGLVQASIGLETQIQEWNPPAVNDLTSVSNPFSPILVNNGTTYAGTPPAGAVNLTKWDTAGIFPGLCALYSWGIHLQIGTSGGTFEIESVSSLGAIGTSHTIAGFQGLITSAGPFEEGSRKGWRTSGIFGARALNKQLLLVANPSSTKTTAGLLPTVYLQSPGAASWSTLATAAKDIGAAAGVGVQWSTIDQPLTDMFAETGMTVMSALQSLASRVNAVIVWDGGVGYKIIDPSDGYGGAHPSTFNACSLLGPGGIKYEDILDLNDDIALLPVAIGSRNIVDFADSALAPPKPPKIENLMTFASKPKVNRRTFIDLPGDYVRKVVGGDAAAGKIQVIPNLDKTSSSPYTVPKNLTDTNSNSPTFGQILYNPSVWFDVSLPVYVDPSSGIEKAAIDASFFPADLNDGEFELHFGYVRDTSGLEANAIDVANALAQQLQFRLAAENNKSRFFRSRVSSISEIFQGAIPLPGQNVAFSADGIDIFGIIESVEISGQANGAYITIGIANYIRLNKLSAQGTLDFYYAASQPLA